jgi:hypothetical protein
MPRSARGTSTTGQLAEEGTVTAFQWAMDFIDSSVARGCNQGPRPRLQLRLQ